MKITWYEWEFSIKVKREFAMEGKATAKRERIERSPMFRHQSGGCDVDDMDAVRVWSESHVVECILILEKTEAPKTGCKVFTSTSALRARSHFSS